MCSVGRLGKATRGGRRSYRVLFRSELDRAAIDDIRLALNQDQPLVTSGFVQWIEKMTVIRRQPKPRGRPRLEGDTGAAGRTEGAWTVRIIVPGPFFVADIVGHEKPRITYGLYSGGASMETEREALEKVRYPFRLV